MGAGARSGASVRCAAAAKEARCSRAAMRRNPAFRCSTSYRGRNRPGEDADAGGHPARPVLTAVAAVPRRRRPAWPLLRSRRRVDRGVRDGRRVGRRRRAAGGALTRRAPPRAWRRRCEIRARPTAPLRGAARAAQREAPPLIRSSGAISAAPDRTGGPARPPAPAKARSAGSSTAGGGLWGHAARGAYLRAPRHASAADQAGTGPSQRRQGACGGPGPSCMGRERGRVCAAG